MFDTLLTAQNCLLKNQNVHTFKLLHGPIINIIRLLKLWCQYDLMVSLTLSPRLEGMNIRQPPHPKLWVSWYCSTRTIALWLTKFFRYGKIYCYAELHSLPGNGDQNKYLKVMRKNPTRCCKQTIRRLKYLRILKHDIILTLISQIDKVIYIITALCNLYPQLS